MAKYQEGFKFSDPIRDYEVIKFVEKYNMYLLKNFTDNRQDELMQESEIDYYISKKEQIEAKRAKNKIFLQKQEEQQRLEEEKERQEQERYNNVYGYCDNMTPMQTGKVLKVLNKKEIYYNNGVYVGSIARKEFIFDVLNNGGKIELKTNLKYYDKKAECFKIKDKEYRLYIKEDINKVNMETFYEITKTEYDYSMYLINKGIIKAA